MLASSFVPTNDFEALRRGPTHHFVVGRRGAGKSALFLQLMRTFHESPDKLVFDIRPEEFRIKGLVTALKDLLGKDAQYSAVRSLMRVVWRAAILAHVEKRVLMEDVPQWLAPDILATAQNIIEAVEAGDEDRAIYAAAKITDVETREPRVRSELASAGIRPIVLVDRLDEGWRPLDTEAGIVGGLCAAAADFQDKESNIHILMFLRDNVYRVLAEIDDDFSRNMAGDTLRLRWTQKVLLDLVARRLRNALHLNQHETNIKVWNRFAKSGLEEMEGFLRCLQKTLYRPRDILELLNNAAQVAQRQGRREIIPSDLDDAAHDIATSRLTDLIKEYEEVFPGLSSYVDAFKARPAVDTLANVIELLERERGAMSPHARRTFAKLGNPMDVLQSLFGVGFIGFELSGSGFRFCHDGTDVPTGNLPLNTRVAVHPCYSRALKVDPADQPAFDVLLRVNDEYDEQKPNKQRIAAALEDATQDLLNELPNIELGDNGASAFETWTFRVLSILFAADLTNFEKHPNRDAPQRRDIAAANEAKSGLWKNLRDTYGAGHVIFEVKNFENLTPACYHQAKAYTGPPYGRVVFIVYRSLRNGLDDNERSWVQEFWGSQVLLVLIPVALLTQCLRKQITRDRGDYTSNKFTRWVHTHERSYVHPRAGKRDRP